MIAEGASILATGVVYSLTHSCSVNGSTGEAAIQIDVNIPPRGGEPPPALFSLSKFRALHNSGSRK